MIEAPLAVAVSIAVWLVFTAVADAVKAALTAPIATVIDAGTVTALLLLARVTVSGLAAAPVSVTVQASVAAPVSDGLLHETPLSPGCPVPLSAIVGWLEALLLIVTAPLTAPATVGSKPMVSTAVCPAFSVIGALIPDTENPVPVTVAPLRMSWAVPVDVNVTVCVVGVFRSSVPNAKFVVLKLSPGTAAFNCSPNAWKTPPAVAVSVTVCGLVTADADAVNAALNDPAATVTDAGSVTALLLLAKLTVKALGAAAVSVTVQASVAAPVSDALLQVIPLRAGCPVPLSAMVALAALLLIVTAPVTAPATAGSNPTVSVAVWPGFSVTGVLIPVAENPGPLTEIPLIVSAAVPEDVTVTACAVGVFNSSVPNATLVLLRFSAAVTALSCRAYVAETPFAVAVSVAVCAVLTAVAVAVNGALEAPAATVTDPGTVTTLLLLARFTVIGLAAAAVSVTEQVSVPAPVTEAPLHETALNAG